VARKTEKDIKEFLKEAKKPKVVRHTASNVVSRHKKESRFPWKPVIAICGVGILVLCGFLYFKLQKATVEIWPNVETLNFSQKIVADKSANDISLTDDVIPAKYVEVEKTETQQFSATGNASDEGKAGGTVTMYNTSSTALTLKSGTHLLSDSGKYFTTLAKVAIPGGSKAKPGSAQVKVQAAEGGEAYNIGPANFSVPKLSGTNYYYSTYAVSAEAMTGGFSGDVKKVTEDDIAGAKDSLIETVSAEALEQIKSQLGEDYVVLDDAVSYETKSSSSDSKSGTVISAFNYTATVKVSALAFKKSDLDKICKDYIISQMGQDKTILDSSFSSEYSLKSVDIEEGAVALDVNFSAGTYKTINKSSLALTLMGKTADEISSTINSDMTDAVSRIKVDFYPFWVKKAPNNQKAIDIELKF